MNDRLRQQQRDAIALGELTIDLQRGELFDAFGHRVPLRRQSLAVLLELARQPGAVLSRDALSHAVWKGVHVTEDSLVQCIVEIRRALGPRAALALKTVPRRGYVLEESGLSAPDSPAAGTRSTSHAAAADLAEATAQACGPLSRDLPFVGRQAELDELMRSAGAPPRRGCVMLVAGEPGIGKSRLIVEAAAGASGSGADTISLKCHEIEAGIAFGSLSQLVERLVAHADLAALRDLDGALRAELAALVPWCADRLEAVAPVEAGDSALRQARLRAALVRLCGTCATDRPFVICIDDAHWLDEPSAVALFAVAEAAPQHAYSIWATVRHDEIARNPKAEQLVHELLQLPHVSNLELHRLNTAQVEEIVRHVRGPHSAAASEVASLVRQSAGNPFYLRELLYAQAPMVAGADTDADADAADAAAAPTRRISPVPVLPAGILEAVLHRAHRLPKPAVRLLEAAAVLEQSTAIEVLCSVSRLERPEALEALEQLLSGTWLVEDRERARYPFAHDKLREAIYTSMSEAMRRTLHGRAAHTLLEEARRRSAPPEHAVVATHAQRAGLEILAMQQFALAGDAARRMFELRRAEVLYSQALAFEQEAGDAALLLERISLLERRGAVRSMLGAASGAELDLRRAIMLAGQAGHLDASGGSPSAALVQLHIELGVMLQRHNRLEDALAALRRGLDLAQLAENEGAAAAAHCWLGDVEWMRERNREARSHFEAARASRALASPAAAPLLTKALFGLAQCAGMDARPAVADKLLDLALERAQSPAERFFQCAWAVLKGWIRIGPHGMGEPEAAIEYFGRCLRLSRETDLFWYSVPCEIGIGVAHAMLRRPDTALEHLEAVLRLPTNTDHGRWRLAAGVWLASCHLQRGDPAGALGAARQAQRALAEFGPFMFSAMLPALVCSALVRLGRGTECEDPQSLVDEARRSEMGFVLIAALEARAEWLGARGEAEQMLACAEELLREADERGLPLARTVAMEWRTRALELARRDEADDPVT